MNIIKLYDKTFTEISSLTEKDFNDLNYQKSLDRIGSCRFQVNINNKKVTDSSIGLYNRIEVLGENGVEFVGIITKRTVRLNTATIQCRELSYILKKRLVGTAYTLNDTVANAITQLLSDINTTQDTGISIGDVSGATGSVNNTYNRSSAYSIIDEITRGTNNQFILRNDRTLDVGADLGTDLSSDIILRYEKDLVAAATITDFNVTENGGDIVTKAYGKSDTLTSTQEDSGLQTDFGLLEKYKNFRVLEDQTTLDNFTTQELRGANYSPRITINPEFNKEFRVGDKVKVILKNDLINLNNTFQIVEKMVDYKQGNQKEIRVRISDNPENLAEKLAERERRLQLLEEEL